MRLERTLVSLALRELVLSDLSSSPDKELSLHSPHPPPLVTGKEQCADKTFCHLQYVSFDTRQMTRYDAGRRLIEGDIKNSLLSKRISVLYFYPPTPPLPSFHSSFLPPFLPVAPLPAEWFAGGARWFPRGGNSLVAWARCV